VFTRELPYLLRKNLSLMANIFATIMTANLFNCFTELSLKIGQ
jgi:hypothetical protein